MGEYGYSYGLPVDFENRAEHILHQMVAHNFFRELTTAWRNTDRAPAYDFRWLNNKSLTKGARTVSANIVSVDEMSLRKNIKNLARKTVEETLNALLFIVWDSGEGRRDGRDVADEWGRSWLRPL